MPTAPHVFALDTAASRPYPCPELSEGWPTPRTFGLGHDHAAVLSRSGEVLCVGDNSQGQLGDGTQEPRYGLVPAALPWAAGGVSCGWRFVAALAKGGGAVCSWGWAEGGRLGRGGAGCRPRVLDGLPSKDPVVTLETGYAHVFVVTASGEAFGWGCNSCGELALGPGAGGGHAAPVRVAALCGRGVRRIACGDSFSVAETAAGELLAWGRLGTVSAPRNETLPVALPTAAVAFPLRSLAAGGGHAALADAAGALWELRPPREAPARAALPVGERVVRVAAAGQFRGQLTVALTAGGRLWDCSSPVVCRSIDTACPDLPRGLVPYGGVAADRVVFVPDSSCGSWRLRLLLLAADRLRLLPGDRFMRRSALCPLLVAEEYLIDYPEGTAGMGAP
eukprot:TRINITY_DN11753_c1_g1_i2.p1 TRINITY_DN11753_c1_g1~~TRINITY_DN11753_c1_g1_i2.p1  ORF type:complete len:393 (+),score=49.38 TRINITY_DN11753_c1_g1_i2:100-1278(+)